MAITTIQQTVTASSAYTAGNAVGGKITLPGLVSGDNRRCAITDVVLIDKANQSVPYDLVFFDSDLAGSVADKSAFAINASDLSKLLGSLSLSGLSNLGSNGGVINGTNIYKRLTLVGRDAYAVLITRGTPTYASTSDVILRVTSEEVYS